MSNNPFIEDIFIDLADTIMAGSIIVPQVDYDPIISFYNTISSSKQLTKKQADYLIRLLIKYQTVYESIVNVSIANVIANPVWRQPFRTLDYSKSVSVTTNEAGIDYIHLKFPFALKDMFIAEFATSRGKSPATWDAEEKVQKIKIHDINIIQLYEFVKKNNFDIADDFLSAVSQVEEIWASGEEFSPRAYVVNNNVEIFNYTDSAKDYFNQNKSNSVIKDLFLARSMGYPLANSDKTNRLDRLFSSTDTNFWIRDLEDCFKFIKDVDSFPIVLFLDRASNVVDDVRTFCEAFKSAGFDETSIRVCFRFSNDDDGGKEFNQWIKENGLGGKMTSGKIFICQHKPPKWMMSSDFTPKILISNSLYPSTSQQTSHFIKHHHTVFYVGSVKPSMNKEYRIVEL
jgi:hypothetical protein